jgi:anti-sigma B factor antagonist
MQLQVIRKNDISVIRIKEAKMTYPLLSPFFAEVQQIVESGARKLVIDLETVIYIDSVFIGCLIDIHRLLEHRGGILKVSGLQPRVEVMLSMTGVQKVVDIYGKEEHALAAFARSRGSNRAQPPLLSA